jgi:hypothetical protein
MRLQATALSMVPFEVFGEPTSCGPCEDALDAMRARGAISTVQGPRQLNVERLLRIRVWTHKVDSVGG